MTERINMNLDRVERTLVEQLKEMSPEYANLSLHDVAHEELRRRLFARVKELKQVTGQPRDEDGLAGSRTLESLYMQLLLSNNDFLSVAET